MSYCVQCGVELSSGEEACPLCQTVVVNPNQQRIEPEGRPYSTRVESVVNKADRKFAFTLASELLLIPVVISIISNMLVQKYISWSLYVAGGALIIFVASLVPLLFKKPKPYLFWALNSVTLIMFIAMVSYETADLRWFLPLGLPLCLAVSVTALLMIWALQRVSGHVFYRLTVILALAGMLAVPVNAIISVYLGTRPLLTWALFVVAPSIILAVVFFSFERRKKVRDEIRKRLFV